MGGTSRTHSGLGLDIVEDAGDNFIFSLIFLFLA